MINEWLQHLIDHMEEIRALIYVHYTVCSVFTYNVHLDVIIYSMSYFISDTATQHISMLNENSLIH